MLVWYFCCLYLVLHRTAVHYIVLNTYLVVRRTWRKLLIHLLQSKELLYRYPAFYSKHRIIRYNRWARSADIIVSPKICQYRSNIIRIPVLRKEILVDWMTQILRIKKFLRSTQTAITADKYWVSGNSPHEILFIYCWTLKHYCTIVDKSLVTLWHRGVHSYNKALYTGSCTVV